MRALLIGENELALIADLRNRATNAPVDMSTLMVRLQDPTEKERHKAQMTAQSIVLPVGYLVTCSIETGHPFGRTCRHISVSIPSEMLVPHPAAVFEIAELFGFVLKPGNVHLWLEDLEGHGKAVNLVQDLALAPIDREEHDV